MDRQTTFDKIVQTGVVPVINKISPDDALRVVDAIYRGGVNVIEVTMNGPSTMAVLEKIVKEYDDRVALGAGTVLNPEMARDCLSAGADFIVSPVFDPETIDMVKSQGSVMIAGALTPTEVVTAWDSGVDAVLIFPCGAVGGPKYLASLKQTFPEIQMMPTGSLNLETVGEFLRAGASAIVIGSAFIDGRNIEERNYQIFEERARRYATEVTRARGHRG